MTENNTCSEVMISMFVLVGKWSENKLKTVLQNKTAGVGGGRIIFVGKVAVCSRVLNWRMKFNYGVQHCQ